MIAQVFFQLHAALLIALMGSSVWASTQQFPVHENQQLILTGVSANLSLTGAAGSQMSVTMDPVAEAHYAVQLKGEQIRIVEKTLAIELKPDSRAKAKIDIQGPPMSLEVHLREGSIALSRWTRDSLLQIQKGKITAKDNQGTLAAHVEKGDISIQDHHGKVFLDAFQATSSVKNLQGDLDMQNFSGEVVLERTSGTIIGTTNQGSVKINGGEGELQFESQKTNWSIQNFNGRIEAQNNEGSITVKLADDQDLNAKTQSGKVFITAPVGSGALLNLSSAEGDVYVPAYLKISRDGSAKSLRGRLKGDSQKASILVHTQDGQISLK